MGPQALSIIASTLSEDLKQQGWMTTTTQIEQQNLKSGEFRLTIQTGRIGQIIKEETETGHRTALPIPQNLIPAAEGSALNLKDIEQGLENLRRIASHHSEIRIEEGSEDAQHNIIIQQSKLNSPISVIIGADNNGGKETGKHTGSLTIKLDNPLNISDIFYFSRNKAIGGTDNTHALDGSKLTATQQSSSYHYSLPYRHWLIAINHNRSHSAQLIDSGLSNHQYSGESENSSLTLSRLLQRSKNTRTQLDISLWRKKSRSRFDDIELSNQTNRSAGWTSTLEHRIYLPKGEISSSIEYRKGTALMRARRFADEAEAGTSRFKLTRIDTEWTHPYRFNANTIQAYTQQQLSLQRGHRSLRLAERFHLGSNIPGFDGQQTQSGKHGYQWRNENGIIWGNHTLYTVFGIGRIEQPPKSRLKGRTLAGIAIGIKGSKALSGSLMSYSLSFGIPLIKPKRFQTHKNHTAFNLSINL